MPPKSAAAVIVLLMLAAGPARANDADVLRAVGLLGMSAVDCAAPPSRDNPHAVFADGGAGVTYTWKSDPAALDQTSRVRAVSRLADDRIQMEIEGSTKKFIKVQVLILKANNVWYTDRSELEGRLLISDGVVVGRGTPIARFHRCGDR